MCIVIHILQSYCTSTNIYIYIYIYTYTQNGAKDDVDEDAWFEENIKDVKVATIGNVDSGKSGGTTCLTLLV